MTPTLKTTTELRARLIELTQREHDLCAASASFDEAGFVEGVAAELAACTMERIRILQMLKARGYDVELP